MNWPATLLLLTPLLTACGTWPAEHRLVGTWTAPAKGTTVNDGITIKRSYSKEMVDLTLRPDHTFVWSRHGGRPTDFGHWRLDGRYLLTEYTNRAKGHKVAHAYRDRITKLTSTELVYIQSEDTPDTEAHLTRRSSEPLVAPSPRFR